MDKTTILTTAIDRQFGAMAFQANLLSQINKAAMPAESIAIFLKCIASAADEYNTETRVWQDRQLKTLLNPNTEQ